ncbi:MAG: NAD(P)/FAD-dependent oxidoreductase [Ardenticatenia bacterium]|nr:NAD(P)/FAD-dependent oxidoreductase [Ardenticatenia bacterium]
MGTFHWRNQEPPNVAIIGASAAGLFAATLLAQEGLPVRVYEANETLDPLPRTLIITRRLSQVLGFVPSEAVINQVQHIELISRSASARVTLRQPDLIVERESLIRLLAERAQQAGAEIVPGQRFVGFDDGSASSDPGLGLLLLKLRRSRPQEERAAVVIGADGAHSRVAEAAAHRGQGAVAIMQALVALPPGADPHTVRVWFARGDTRFFYWLIPESKERAVVGLIAEEEREAEAKLKRFLSAHGFEPQGYQGALVAVHRFASRPWAEVDGRHVLLVGDAAGQVKMTTVGGVVAGLRGARAAAHAILGPASYRQELRGLKQELDLHLLMRSILDRFSDADYDELLCLLNRRAKDVLETCNRDEMGRAVWRLLAVQPRWLSVAARALLRRLGTGQPLAHA